jgi:hypothetical protein
MGNERLRAEVLRIAVGNLGYGEGPIAGITRNNDGPLIREIGGRPGEEWCALFAGYCYRRAYANLGRDERWPFRRPGVLETGAKALVRAAWAAGALRLELADASFGDLVAWHRGALGWKGHVAIVEKVEDGIVHTIEGNVGRFPAKVRRLSHDVTKERLFGFAGFR